MVAQDEAQHRAGPLIVWINGAFGAGKTTAAYELHRRLPGSLVFDPEEAGFYIRARLPKHLHGDDFQDYPMWRSINREMLAYLAENHPGPIIVPMTVVSERYMDELVGALRSSGVRVDHYALTASRQTLLRRLRSRWESERSWAAQQIDRCLAGLAGETFDVHIQTDGMNASEVVARIAELSGLALTPDRRGPLKRGWDRLRTKAGHIRFGR
ncbi:AAA family ATPase [Cohnella hashimotonis]|uniref:AAA family ATPase n=1 Tax=Cohnella hashimotonis TaxID=2826895 RepID=A0ABT6TFV6_9BACL|nr:AAA family ATPase [Cohnella hashimotonis]MDI4645724.1 AAA family ATPase [Cohnella hashimotonis]